jgi:ankyrin repeat protein
VLAVFQGREQVAAYLCALPLAEPDAHIVAACWLGDVHRVRDFIARGASVEERDMIGATCLMLAAMGGHVEVVRALLAAGADVDASVDEGATPEPARTAVEYAATTNNLEVVQELVAAGADVNRIDERGNSMAARAAKAGNANEAVVAYLCRLP